MLHKMKNSALGGWIALVILVMALGLTESLYGGWEEVPSPTNEMLLSVYADSINGTWASALSGYVLHFDGNTWQVDTQLISIAQLNSIFFISPSDGWVAGHHGDGATGIIYHFNGTFWDTVSIPDSTHEIKSLYFLSPDNGWAVGRGSTILHWDGTQWQHIDPPVTSFFAKVYAFSDTNVWIVGYFPGVILHFNNIKWDTLYLSSSKGFTNLFFLTPTTGWFTGLDTLVWKGIVLKMQNGILDTNPTYFGVDEIDGIRIFSDGTGWAFGHDTIYYYDRSQWSGSHVPDSQFTGYLRDMDFVSEDEGWIVGNDGIILRYSKSGIEERNYISPSLSLFRVIPNPIGEEAVIFYSLKKEGDVKILVYNTLGQRVDLLKYQAQKAGIHRIKWHRKNIPNGLYFFQLKAGRDKVTTKLILLQ